MTTKLISGPENSQLDIPQSHELLIIFTDGSFEPGSAQAGWAFVVYADQVEVLAGAGRFPAAPGNNAVELTAILNAARWLNAHAANRQAVILTDSRYVLEGCNRWRFIWRSNGWKRIEPDSRRRKRAIADRALWQSLDIELQQNDQITVNWCKAHSGIAGNIRADALATQARLAKTGDNISASI